MANESRMNGEGGASALKGLRLLTVDRGPEGFGFHMYTNRSLKVLTKYITKIGGMLVDYKQL